MTNNIDPKLQEVLAKLKDVMLPSDPSWWPPAPGRTIVSILVILIITAIIKKIANKLLVELNVRAKKQAISELDQILNNINNNRKNLPMYINSVNLLLKKCALKKFNDKKIQSLSGNSWLEFLDKTYNKKYFSSLEVQGINNLRYMDNNSPRYKSQETPKHVKEFIDNSKSWINFNL